MSKAFTSDYSRERDIRETLARILAEADTGYMNSVDVGRFEQGLIDEVHFLLPGDEEDMRHVEQYIHIHKDELYQIARHHR